MSATEIGRVWCDNSVESVTLWLDEEDCSPTELSRRLLEKCPRFALNAQEEVLDMMLYIVTRGILQIRSGEVGVGRPRATHTLAMPPRPIRTSNS